MRIAALVAPRTTPPASRKRTVTRFTAGANGTIPAPCANTAKVDVWPASIGPVAAGPGAVRRWAVAGFVGPPLYSVTVPGGILQGQQSNFLFSDPKGKAGNGLRRLSLRVKDRNTILIFATVRGADLHGADRSDLTVRAQIGDDCAAQTVTLRPRSTGGWVFP